MKKILFKTEEKPTINFEELNDDSIVGLEDRYGKSLIIRTAEGFCPISNCCIDLRIGYKGESLKEYIETFNKVFKELQFYQFYQFDTVKDALKWMARD